MLARIIKLVNPDNKTNEKPKPRHKIWRLTLLTTVPLLILASAGTFYLFNSHKSSPIPKNIRQSARFTLYYPSPMPAGFSFDQSSLSFSNQVLIIAFKSSNGSQLTLSEQLKPSNFDFSQLKQGVKFPTVYGNAVISSTGNRVTGSLLAGNTWILFNTTGPLDTSQLQNLIGRLRPLN